jgi:outer membrane protein OmpA-like peptidoglycan-associated protein
MRVLLLALAIAILSLSFSGCSSIVQTVALSKAQQDYLLLREDPKIKEHASMSLFQAGKIYDLSKKADSKDVADHYAYLLNQELKTIKDSAQEDILQEKLLLLREKKSKALLDAKNAELDRAKEEVRRAKAESVMLANKFAQLEELNAQLTNRGLVLTLGDVLFETNKAFLMSGAKRGLEKLVEFLQENPQRVVLIEGHTDNVGSSIHNLDLSLRRAGAVGEFLHERGVEKERIIIKGYGEQYPIASNKDMSGRQQNRRVEIVIVNENTDPNTILR